MSVEALPTVMAATRANVLRQPYPVLFPPAEHFSAGFGEAGWRAAMLASNEHLIPRVLTLGFKAAPESQRIDPGAYLAALLSALQLQAAGLAEDREVVAMVLQLGLAEQLPPTMVGQLLDAVPARLRTVARPQVEVRVDAGSRLQPAALREVGCTRLTVLDRANADGPAMLAAAQQVGFTACYYQLRVPSMADPAFVDRLRQVLACAPERIVLPTPDVLPADPDADAWWQAWQEVRAAGYQALGGDHYQRGDLAMPVRPGDGMRHCDMAAVPRRERCDFIGIGLGARSQIGDVYCCLEQDMARWQARLSAGHSGVASGLILSERECLGDEVVQSIACDHALDVAAFEWRNALPFRECFSSAMNSLQPLLESGWLHWDNGVLRLQHEGELLWRMIAACFRSVDTTA